MFEDTAEIQEPDFPEPSIDHYETFLMDWNRDPENIRNDKKHFDRHYGYPSELGRVSFSAALVSRDGFRDILEMLAGYGEIEVTKTEYGDITVYEDCCGDYVAFSKSCIAYSPDHVNDAMAVASDPDIAKATLRSYYDLEFGQQGFMVSKGMRYNRKWQRQKDEEYKEEGVNFTCDEVEEPLVCESCGSEFPAGSKVWSIVQSPGREYNNQCAFCARSKANSADEDGWSINGEDPRDHEIKFIENPEEADA